MVTEQISFHSTVLTFFNIFKTTVCLLNITFVLDRCPAAAGIPVKYYCDSKNLTVMSMKIKYFLTEKLTKEGFVTSTPGLVCQHDDVIKWKHFAPYWPFVWGIPRSPVNSPHKGQWDGALMFSLICTRTNGWANNRNAGELRRNLTHYDVTVMEVHKPGHQCPANILPPTGVISIFLNASDHIIPHSRYLEVIAVPWGWTLK